MNTPIKIIILLAVAAAVAGAVVMKNQQRAGGTDGNTALLEKSNAELATPSRELPRLVDLGADKCIPCKAMAPILTELKRDYARSFSTEFIDVWKNPDAGKQYGVEMIPTQIFFDASGKELFRHVGFFGKEDILAKWKELGVDVSGKEQPPIVRETALAPDARAPDQVCFMCDGDVPAQSRTIVRGQTEERVLCGPHCYFIYFSSLIDPNVQTEEAKVQVTDCSSGALVPGVKAVYLYGMDEQGRATIKAFSDREAALKQQQSSPGSLIGWDLLRSKELATRCGFCDRAVYPEDACAVKIGTTRAYGCCTHCSLGVAARLNSDIEVEAKDGFSGDFIRVKTMNGQIAALEPPSAVAWFGQKPGPEGKWVSAGCFKQGFFINQDNLRSWLELHPAMTGRQITIAQALADKMKLSPEQIAKACKVGECK